MDRVELGKSLNLFEEFIPEHMPNRKGINIRPTSITLHNTSNAGSGADADAHSNWVRRTGYYMWNGKRRWVSWHYTVDDTKVIKQLPLNEWAIHAGNANGSSIAIETCMHREIDQQKADQRLAKLVAALLYDFSWDTTKVKSHRDWTGKDCPILLLPKWDALISEIDAELGRLRTGGRVFGLLSGLESEFEFSSENNALNVDDEGLAEIDHAALRDVIGGGQ